MFKDAKVGDDVYCLINGEGKITCINNYVRCKLPIVVTFNNKLTQNYTDEGTFSKTDLTPVLYHSKPEIIIPKKLIRYCNIYNNSQYFETINVYKTKDKAIENAGSEAIQAGCKVTIEYKVEE